MIPGAVTMRDRLPTSPIRRLAITATLLVVALAFACSPPEESGPVIEEISGPSAEPHADFRLATLDGGEKLGPPDFAGKVVVIDFWATWCTPCRKQAEIMDTLHAELDGDDVQFLAVDLGEDAETVRKFVEENPFPYPVLLDPEDNLTYEIGIYGLPTVMVVDRDGNVSYFETGILPEEQLRKELAAAGA